MTAVKKIYLQNARSINSMYGYGEGKTREEAIANALMLAQRRDPKAYFDGVQVVFVERVVC